MASASRHQIVGLPGAPEGGVGRSGLWKPSSTGMSGIVIGGFAGAAIAGPIGATVGMALGIAAGEALEHRFPSRIEHDPRPRA